jgi:hypothetical protein
VNILVCYETVVYLLLNLRIVSQNFRISPSGTIVKPIRLQALFGLNYIKDLNFEVGVI